MSAGEMPDREPRSFRLISSVLDVGDVAAGLEAAVCFDPPIYCRFLSS